MNVNAISHAQHAAASAANASVTREMRRRSTFVPKINISNDVIAVGIADGEKPFWKTSNATM
jgi:hypothetical protein